MEGGRCLELNISFHQVFLVNSPLLLAGAAVSSATPSQSLWPASLEVSVRDSRLAAYWDLGMDHSVGSPRQQLPHRSFHLRVFSALVVAANGVDDAPCLSPLECFLWTL